MKLFALAAGLVAMALVAVAAARAEPLADSIPHSHGITDRAG